jgi:hypothetical protein
MNLVSDTRFVMAMLDRVRARLGPHDADGAIVAGLRQRRHGERQRQQEKERGSHAG